MRSVSGAVLVVVVASLAGGCGSDPDCADQCLEAQEQSCPFVAGDCEAFCGAMRSVADRTDCGAEGDAWEGCLTAETSCGWAERCVAEQEAYEACVAPYCQHPGPEAPPDAECALIEEALHPADR